MGLQRGGTEGKALAKATTVGVLSEIRANSREKLAFLEVALGLSTPNMREGTLPSGDRYLKLLNPKRGGLPAAKMVQVVRVAWEHLWLSDDRVFELGLRDAIRAKHAADVLERRNLAHKIFRQGVERMLRGVQPLASGGRRGGKTRRLQDDLEGRRSYDAWIDEIHALGAWVMDIEEWSGWFNIADSQKSMQQTAEDWSAPRCPPWISDRDYWEEIYSPYHHLLLSRLVLICDGDHPYSPYPRRISMPRCGTPHTLAGERHDDDEEIVVKADDLSDFYFLHIEKADLGLRRSQKFYKLEPSNGAKAVH